MAVRHNLECLSRPLHSRDRFDSGITVRRGSGPVKRWITCQPGVTHNELWNIAAPRHAIQCRALSDSSDAASLREQARRLANLFYQSPDVPANQQTSTTPEQLQQQEQQQLPAGTIRDLPLWRVQWAVLPGMQNILHVHVPHYVHMFETVFRGDRPWRFGHLYLPGGSKNLGEAQYALQPGSSAPLVGTLMEVTRAVRLNDGKLIILATAVGRFKVLQGLQESPYSRAHVTLLPDVEQLAAQVDTCLDLALSSAPAGTALEALMAASSSAAALAAAAEERCWQTYEVATARKHEWREEAPREGRSEAEMHALVQDVVQHGVGDVLPLPDGPVVGRWDLQQLQQQAAAEALEAAAGAVSASLQQGAAAAAGSAGAGSELVAGLAEAPAGLTEGEQAGSSSDTGIDIYVDLTAAGAGLLPGSAASSRSSSPTASTDDIGTGSESESDGDTSRAEAAAEAGAVPAEQQDAAGGGSTEQVRAAADVARLERYIWNELDAIASLALKVRGKRLALPLGLLQLRPPPREGAVLGPAGRRRKLAAAVADAAGRRSVSPPPSPPPSRPPSPPAPAPVVAAAAVEAAAPGPDAGAQRDSSVPQSAQAPQVAEQQTQQQEQQEQERPAQQEAQQQGAQQQQGVQPAAMLPRARMPSAYKDAASDGLDVHADQHYPVLRRAARLSFAVASALLDLAPGDGRQALLEQRSISARLRLVLSGLIKHRKVLAALAAVKGIRQTPRRRRVSRDPDGGGSSSGSSSSSSSSSGPAGGAGGEGSGSSGGGGSAA